jgi:hypothetical protein
MTHGHDYKGGHSLAKGGRRRKNLEEVKRKRAK